ncbi:MobP3 family relaxase [Caproicibacter sp.]|uniref:MobP3 family relaxase n=1 Tax=Caproicibacter sp. TaxID=2814884 RepID=UPI00398A2EFC
MYKQRFRNPNYRKTPKCNYAHIGYIATRPGASKNEGMRHGLFGKLSPSKLTEFETWQEAARDVRELSYRRVNMFRGIISFSPETAAELKLNGHEAWEEYIERHIMTLAQKNGIRAENLSWVAAHHNERGHPHLHVVFWDKNQKLMKNYVSPKVPNSIRIQLIKDTFPEKIAEYCRQKGKIKGELNTVTDELITEFDEYMQKLYPKEYRRLKEEFGRIGEDELLTSPLDSMVGNIDLAPYLKRLFVLKDKMPKQGRLVDKLLPAEVKAEIDTFVLELKNSNEYIRNLVADYAESKCCLAMLYDSDPENMETYRKQAVAEADKLIANKILRVIKSILRKERELSSFEFTQARKEWYTEQMICEILMMLEQNIISLDMEYDDAQKSMGTELSKTAKKEWYLRHKDKGMEV